MIRRSLLLLVIGSCTLWGCQGNTPSSLAPTHTDTGAVEQEDDFAAPPDPHNGGGTSAGNPILLEDVTAGGPSTPIADMPPPLVPPDNGPEAQDDGLVPTSSGCMNGDPYAEIDGYSPIFLIGKGTTNDVAIDLSTHLLDLFWPLMAPGPHAPFLHPTLVATHPKGGVAFFLPINGVPCQFFVLENSLQTMRCIDPTETSFGLLPWSWRLPPSLRRSPIQFDAAGNIYYRWLPPEMKWQGNCESQGIHPSAQIRRWDRATGTVTTIPLGSFLPFRFHVLPDGAMLVMGSFPSDGAHKPTALRYVLPNGNWDIFALPVSTSGATVPDGLFHVVNGNTVILPLAADRKLVAIPFGPMGFGEPSTLVTKADNLTDAEGNTYGAMATNIQSGPDGTLYAFEMGLPGLPWFPTYAIMRVTPPIAFVDTPATMWQRFFRIVDDHFYVAGMTNAGHDGLFDTPVASPGNGPNLLGNAQYDIHDLLRVDDHLYFSSGYNTYGLGRIDLNNANHLSILATAQYEAPTLYPIWPTADATTPPSSTDPTDGGILTGTNLGCFKNLSSTWLDSGYLINMEANSDGVIDFQKYLETTTWPQWGLDPVKASPNPTHMATDPKGGVAFLNGTPVPFGDGTCAFFALDPTLQNMRCIDPTATDFGLLPEPWDQSTSLRRSPIQFDADGNIYYRALPPNAPCELGSKAALNPKAEIRRWDRITGKVTTYPLGSFLPFRFHVLPDGALLVSGFALAPSSTSPWPILRYVLPNGNWHELALPEFGKADLPFYVVNPQTVIFPWTRDDGLFAVTFGPKGFGAPTPLVTIANNFLDDHQYVHWGMALAAQTTAAGTIYTLDRGLSPTGAWWSWTNALMRVTPGKPSLVGTPTPNPRFFQIVDGNFYLAGRDAAGKYNLVRAAVTSPTSGTDLLGKADVIVYDFLIRRQQVFFSGYQVGPTYGTSGNFLGQIDMGANNTLTTLTKTSGQLYPYWPSGKVP